MNDHNKKGLTLKKINDITTRINSEQELNSLLSVIMDTARELLETEGASLLLYDALTEELVFNITSGSGHESLEEKRVPAGQGIAGMCASTLRPIVVNDAVNDLRVYKNIDSEIGFVTRNLMAIPMIARGKLIGVLEVVNTISHREFNKKDLQLLNYIANMAALALQNRRLIVDLHTRVEELNCIYEISQSLLYQDDVDRVFEEVLRSIRKVLSVERLSLLIKGENNSEAKIIKTLGFDISSNELPVDMSKGVMGIVLRSGDPLLVRDYSMDFNFIPEFADRYKSKSFLSVPILIDDEVMGIINAADKTGFGTFDVFELKVLSTVASQLADYYSRMLARRREVEINNYKRDIKTASEIQLNSLPVIPSHIGDMEIAARYEACLDVGGDFYDLIYHSDDMISFVIADVAGKGIPAALFMEYSKTLLAGVIPRIMDPGLTLIEANTEIFRSSRMGLFVTVMLVQVNRSDKTIRYASAGHNHQILYRKSPGVLDALSARGTPIGAFPDIQYVEQTTTYEPGDLLVLYTDGITEAEKGNKMDFYGEERLFESIQNNAGRSPSQIIDFIYDDINEFRAGADVSDDATMMVIRLA